MANDLATRDVEELRAALSDYKPATHNLLLPTTDIRFVAPDHRVVVNTVHLEPDSDCYPLESKKNASTGWKEVVLKYGLSKRGLGRLLTIAGGSTETVGMPHYHSNGTVTVKARAHIIMPDGIERVKEGTYTWVVPARIEQAERNFEEAVEAANKAGKPPKWFSGDLEAYRRWLRGKFEGERHRIITFATSYAESGAINRAIRQLLTLKDGYTPEEIERPFVCLHAIPPRRPEIDFSHPAIRQLISMAMMNGGALPDLERRPTLQLESGPYVDPMSDAVAAGEAEMPEPPDEYESPPEIEPAVEDVEVEPPEPEPDSEEDDVTKGDFMNFVLQNTPGMTVSDRNKLIEEYLAAGGDNPFKALAAFREDYP